MTTILKYDMTAEINHDVTLINKVDLMYGRCPSSRLDLNLLKEEFLTGFSPT